MRGCKRCECGIVLRGYWEEDRGVCAICEQEKLMVDTSLMRQLMRQLAHNRAVRQERDKRESEARG